MDYLPRVVDDPIRRLLRTMPIVVIDGARGTGKTTTAARFAASQLRLPHDLELLKSDPIGVLQELQRPALIDEWQLAGVEVLWAMKEIVDTSPEPGRFILTGSVEPETYGPTYPLTGRGARMVMRPMTQRELEGRGEGSLWLERLLCGDLAGVRLGTDAATPVVDRMVQSGFPYPAVAGEAPAWLRAYGASIAERSVDERRDPERVHRVLRVLAELEASTVPDERIWQAAEINRETFLAYERMLARTHVTTPAPAWRSNRLKRITSYPKRYFVDAGLSLAVAGIGRDQLRSDPTLAGRYFESFVAAQLRPEVDAMSGTLNHLRTKAGTREIGLLIELGDRLVAIEAKYTTRPNRADAKHLEWLKTEYGDRLSAAVLIHRGSATFQIAEGVWAIPVNVLWG